MADENKSPEGDTFRFSDDGPEYKVDDLSEENKLVFAKVNFLNNQNAKLNQEVAETNLRIEANQVLAQALSEKLKEAVEPKVEVPNESS